MNYELHGRQISLFMPPEHGDRFPASPCIVCGVTCKHVIDEGTAMLVGAMLERGPEHFLYHFWPPCDGDNKFGREIWACRCMRVGSGSNILDYINNVGPFCHRCGASRESGQRTGRRVRFRK